SRSCRGRSRSWTRRRFRRSRSGSRRRSRDSARHHQLTFWSGEIGTERLPRLRAVTRHENAVVADIHGSWLERGVEPLPEIAACDIQVRVSSKIRSDVAPLSGCEIDFDEAIALA